MLRIAILGSKGFIGSFLVDKLNNSLNIEEIDKDELDVLDFEDLEKWMKGTESEVIINCIAYTNVDKAEEEKELSEKLNKNFPEKLGFLAKKYGKFLIHLSSDFVFSGTKTFPGPYKETDILPNSEYKKIGWYAYTKLLGEQSIQKTECRFAIIRLSLPFGNASSEKDLVLKTLQVIDKGYALFTDQLITQTYLPDLASAVKKIIDSHSTGMFHVACHPRITPYDFAVYIQKLRKGDTNLSKGSLQKYIKKNNTAPRPIFGGLDTTSTQEKLGIEFHNIEEALKEFMQNLPVN